MPTYTTTSFKIDDLVTQALIDLGALDPDETPSASEMVTGITKANTLLDSWNADRRFVYANQFFIGNITPTLQPHRIGPGGSANFVMPQRPVKIESANILLNYPGQNTARTPVTVHQDFGSWWDAQQSPNIRSVLPTDLYYQPDWPNGSMFLWVVPTVAYPLELLLWTVLTQFNQGDSFSMPPSYYEGFLYSLVERLGPSFGLPFTPALDQLKRDALRRLQVPNLGAPALGTRDAGIPGHSTGNRSSYNYITKQNNA